MKNSKKSIASHYDVKKILSLICMPFHTKDGFILTERYPFEVKGVDDITAFEAYTNHVHFNDYFDVKTSRDIELLKQICEIWKLRLENQFPGIPMKLYLTLGDEKSPTMRFHRVIENEPLWTEPDKDVIIWDVN